MTPDEALDSAFQDARRAPARSMELPMSSREAAAEHARNRLLQLCPLAKSVQPLTCTCRVDRHKVDGSNATVARGKNTKEDGDVFLTTEQGSIHRAHGVAISADIGMGRHM